MRRWIAFTGWGLVMLLFLDAGPSHRKPDIGRRYYRSAQLFYQRGDYTQALKDWSFIVDNMPQSLYADDALVSIGRYYLEARNDPMRAGTYFRKVLKLYPETDKAPAAQYFLGRIKIQYGRTQQDLKDALAAFDRVSVLYAKTEWAGRAALQAGQIHWLQSHPLISRALCRKAGRSIKAPLEIAEAWLCIARAYALEDRWNDALEAIAHLQQTPGDAGPVRNVLDASTALYRNVYRSETQALSYYADPDFMMTKDVRLKKPRWLVTEPSGIAIVDTKLKLILRYDAKGKFVEQTAYSKLDYAVRGLDGKTYAVRGDGIVVPGRGRRQLPITVKAGKIKGIDVKTIAVDLAGRVWATDSKHGIVLFRPGINGRYIHVENPLEKPSIQPERLQIDAWQRLWWIDHRTKHIRAYDRDGSAVMGLALAPKPKRPISVGFDILGFIYVLDRETRVITIFTPTGRSLKKVDLRLLFPDIQPLDMAVQPDGSLYILDKATKEVYHLI